MTPYSIIVGAAAFALLLGGRTASANRLIRRKLTLSMVLFGGFVALSLGQLYFSNLAPTDPDYASQKELAGRLDSIARLVFALGSINALVALLLNPFRVDRVPDYFPTIVQDAIVIGVFLLAGIFLLGEKWLTLSAVGGFVIGFALQDTLGNLFSGLAIQVEKPFRVGHWVAVGSYEGTVTEITWRATRLRTKAGNSIVLPNNFLSKEPITNYSEPIAPTRLFVEVGASYDAPPNDVKAAILQALGNVTVVLQAPPPAVVVADFAASAILYRVKFWIADYADDDLARDEVRTAIYYALKRRHIEIPYPAQVQYERVEAQARGAERVRELDRLVASVDVFAPLSDEDRAALVAASSEHLYGAGEPIVRQGQPGDSMFVVCRGAVRVTLEPVGQEVARIGAGGYFGEMSLLTGDPRTATVSAVNDTVVLEITADTFRRLAADDPAVIEQISFGVATRREALARSREVAAVATVAPEAHLSLLSRVQKFLGLGG